MANKWKGTPVPKYGAIEKIYLNTKLSTEDVNIELSKLCSSGYDQHYLIYDNSGNKHNSILECSISSYHMRMTYKDPDGNYIDLFTSDEGWKIDYDVIYLNLNDEYYNGQNAELSTPGLISSVISITPFEEEEVIYEGTPVPTEGSLEAVYFNNNMSFEDIIKTLESIPCDISNMPYFVYRSSALTEQDIPEQYVAICKVNDITTIEMRARLSEYTQYIMRIFASEVIDGNDYRESIFGEQLDNYLRHCHKGFSIFNKYIGPDCKGRNSDMGDSYTGSVTMYNNILSPEEVQGAPVGIYNDLLSSLISVTPFKKIVLEPKKNEEPSNNESKEFKTPTTIIKNPHFFLKSSGSGEDNNDENILDNKYIDFTSVVSETEKVPFVNNMMIYVDTSNVTDMSWMFSNCNNLTIIPQLDTSNVTNMEMMFYQCNKITTIPQLDTSNVNNMAGMFYACVALTNVPELDTSKVTSMSEMFAYCRGLLCTPNLDTSNVQNMSNMFSGCTNLSEVLALDTSNVTNMFQMFYECSSLTNVPELDTSNVTDMDNMFYNCTNLTTVSSLNLKSIGNKNYMYHMFSGCNNLENLTLKNIPFDLSLADSPNLTVDSLLNTIQELISSSTMKKLILGSTNYDKLSNIYVKLTNEPEEESGIIKKPFVVCDSTDEGAMKIGSYASSKNWSIQSS